MLKIYYLFDICSFDINYQYCTFYQSQSETQLSSVHVKSWNVLSIDIICKTSLYGFNFNGYFLQKPVNQYRHLEFESINFMLVVSKLYIECICYK